MVCHRTQTDARLESDAPFWFSKNSMSSKPEPQKPQKFSTWARMQAIGAEILLLAGSIILFFYPFSRLQFLAKFIQLGTSLLILGLEYFDRKLVLIYQYKFGKGLVLVAQGGFGMLLAPTHPGGLCCICAGLTYLMAALNGE